MVPSGLYMDLHHVRFEPTIPDKASKKKYFKMWYRIFFMPIHSSYPIHFVLDTVGDGNKTFRYNLYIRIATQFVNKGTH
jgi:hypothetical protein